MSEPLDVQGSVTLNGSGYGVLTLQPPGYRTWTVTAMNVRTDQGPAVTPVPQCTVYLGGLGGRIIAQTYMGNRSTAGGAPEVVQPTQQLVFEWTNGVPGSRATAYLSGTMDMR